MKLNLLPVTVRRGAKTRTAWIFSILLILAGVGAAAGMMIISGNRDKDLKAQVDDARPKAQEAYDTSTQADTVIAKAEGVLRNTSLARAMIRHNGVYPAAYEDLFRFNPPFFRLMSISATPIDEKTASITMVGTLTTYQQYADLSLALMRNPKVVSVARAGFNAVNVGETVPPIVPTDQEGKPHKLNQGPIPDDAMERLAYFESLPATSGYQGTGNYGSGTTSERTNQPGDSLITVTMIATYALQTPNPRASLTASGSAGSSAGAASTGSAIPSAPGPTGGSPAAPESGGKSAGGD